MGDVFEDNDSSDPWNRASLIFGSRKGHPTKLSVDDLLAPSGFGSLRMASMCVVMALCMTLLYLWPILFFVNFWIPLGGHVFGGLFLVGLAAFFVFLYFAATRETQRDRELAARL